MVPVAAGTEPSVPPPPCIMKRPFQAAGRGSCTWKTVLIRASIKRADMLVDISVDDAALGETPAGSRIHRRGDHRVRHREARSRQGLQARRTMPLAQPVRC